MGTVRALDAGTLTPADLAEMVRGADLDPITAPFTEYVARARRNR